MHLGVRDGPEATLEVGNEPGRQLLVNELESPEAGDVHLDTVQLVELNQIQVELALGRVGEGHFHLDGIVSHRKGHVAPLNDLEYPEAVVAVTWK